jgi:(p)ppGpp synthase/HD superfamily hydrolase
MTTTGRAAALAYERHRGQVDPKGRDYVAHHVIPVVAVTGELAAAFRPDEDLQPLIQVAWLHDILEDTDTTFSEVANIVGEDLAMVVAAMTRDPRQPYLDYIRDVALHPTARLVKMADNTVNRREPPGRLAKRYEDARVILWDAEGTRVPRP